MALFSKAGKKPDLKEEEALFERPSSPKTETASDEGIAVNVNEADALELQDIPGVGEDLAGKIIEYRDASGPFKSMDDLLGVTGIGAKKLEMIREYILIEDA